MVRVYTNHGKKSSTHTNHEGKNHPNPWFVYTRTMERKVQLIRIMKEKITQPHGSCIHEPWKEKFNPYNPRRKIITRTHGSCVHEPWKEKFNPYDPRRKKSPEPMVRVHTNHGKKVQPIRIMKENYHPTPWFVYTRTMERKFNPYES